MKKRNQSAFTLLEIMLVVMIIGLLLGTAIYKLRGNVEVSRSVAVQSSLQSVRTQLKLYESMNGFAPTTEQGLQALVAQPQASRARRAGRSCLIRCRRTRGAKSSSTSAQAEKTRTATTYILPGLIGRLIRRTTNGAAARVGPSRAIYSSVTTGA